MTDLKPAAKLLQRNWLIAAGVIGSLILGAYFWTAYTQRYLLSDEPDAVKDVGGVRIESSFSARDLDPGEPAILNVRITNHSGKPLVQPWVTADVPAFKVDPARLAINDIENGGKVTAHLQLRAGSVTGQFHSRVTVGWNAGATAVVADVLPPVVAVRRSAARLQWIAAAIQGLSKDLALPIIVIVLAALIKRKETKDEEARIELQRHDDRLRDTWALMLEKHHENVELYYLPLLASIAEFRRARGEGDEEKTFYFYLQTFWRMRRLFVKIGGLYFKNRGGERVLARAWRLVVLQTDTKFGDRAKRDLAIEKLADPKDANLPIPYPQYDATLKKNKPYVELFDKFKTWPADPAPAELTLDTIEELLAFFYEICRFECNRPYEYWYGAKADDFPRAAVISFAAAVNKHATLAEFRESVPAYYDAIQLEFKVEDVEWPWRAP